MTDGAFVELDDDMAEQFEHVTIGIEGDGQGHRLTWLDAEPGLYVLRRVDDFSDVAAGSDRDAIVAFLAGLLDAAEGTTIDDAPNRRPGAIVRHLCGLMARNGIFDLADYREAENLAYGLEDDDDGS